MDNVTHALAGLIVAEVVVEVRRRLGHEVSPGWARTAWITSAVANNLPDADFVYSWITPGQLGYLLHHRGHTHTLAFAPLMALAAYGVARLLARRQGAPWSRADRAWMVVIAALGPLGHMALDLSNEYGVHPLWPVHNGWFHGDTIFIIEPLFWAAGLPPLALAASSRVFRGACAVLLAAVLLLAWFSGFVPWASVLAIAVLCAVMAAAAFKAPPGARGPLALGASLAVLLMFAVAGRVAEANLRAELSRTHPGWTTLDVARSPVPSTPLCWSAVVVQRSEAGDRYALRRAVASAWPSRMTASQCQTRPRGEVTAPLTVPSGAPARVAMVTGELEAPLAALR
ncbi:MAG TPA: metal-dependent hydrolase, partial [Candidatus Nanopelagicales bacterium]|nr:metal-dependent hydrolase [Candidatus Nanopelagicales bacterium]